MASRAVSLTFHSDDISAERPRCASKVGLEEENVPFFHHFCDLSILVTSKVIIINRAAVTLASYKFRRCAIFGAG